MYTVTYIIKYKRFTEKCAGTEKEIRTKFIKEGKKIIDIQKHMDIPFLSDKKVKKAEIIATFIALSDMLKGEEKLVKALTAIIQSFKKDSNIIPVLTNIRENICKGKQLSECLSEYKEIFGIAQITMIEAGEAAGKLPETLVTVANYLRQVEESKNDLIKKLIQPILTTILGVIGLVVTTTYIIPNITKSELFNLANKKEVSEPVAMIILKQLAWITPSLMFIIIGVCVATYIHFKQNQESAEKILLKIPIIREFIFYRSYFIAFNSLSNLLLVGVMNFEALTIVGKTQKLITIKKEFENAILNISNGQQFATAFLNIDTIERTILEVAQKEDSVQNSYKIIADRFYRLYMEKIRGIGPKIQALVYVFIISLIVLIFMGIMLPYFSVIQNLKG